MDFYNKPSPTLFLMHYGVKGMKWGVRRTPEELGHKPKQMVEKTTEPGIIKTTVYGHSATQSKLRRSLSQIIFEMTERSMYAVFTMKMVGKQKTFI